MKISCPACNSKNVKRITYTNISSDISHQYRTAHDKGACTVCGSLWNFRSVVPHLVKKTTQPSYQ